MKKSLEEVVKENQTKINELAEKNTTRNEEGLTVDNTKFEEMWNKLIPLDVHAKAIVLARLLSFVESMYEENSDASAEKILIQAKYYIDKMENCK